MSAYENLTEYDLIEEPLSEQTGSHDIPIPDDLVEGETGTPRYPLDDDLIRESFDLVPTRYIPQDYTLSQHILLSAPSDQHNGIEHYKNLTQELITKFPTRVAIIRDLSYRVSAARKDLELLQKQIEKERVNLNRRNQSNNSTIDRELASAKKDWECRRDICRKELREVEDELIKY